MGRRRKYPAEAKASVRVAAATARLREAGGARKTFQLQKPAVEMLRQLREMRGFRTETDLIHELIREAYVAWVEKKA